MKIKISPFRKPLTLFKVQTFPLMVPGQNHASVLESQPQYLAINDDDQMYLTFSDLPNLQKEKYYFLGQSQHVIWPLSQKSCIIALFQDQIADITSLCQTFFTTVS